MGGSPIVIFKKECMKCGKLEASYMAGVGRRPWYAIMSALTDKSTTCIVSGEH